MKKIKVAGTGYTTTSRGAVKMAVAGFLLASSILVGIQWLGGQETLPENVEWITVHAEQGDTLWAMIDRKNGDNIDIRELVYLANENGQGNSIIAGQAVQIPVVKKAK